MRLSRSSNAVVLGIVAFAFAGVAFAATGSQMAVNINEKGQGNLSGTISSISGTTLSIDSWEGTWAADVSNARFGPTSAVADYLSTHSTGGYVSPLQNGDIYVGDQVSVKGGFALSGLALSAYGVDDNSLRQREKSVMTRSGTVSNASSANNTFTFAAAANTWLGIPAATYAVDVPTSAVAIVNGNVSTLGDLFTTLSNGGPAVVIGKINGSQMTALLVAAGNIIKVKSQGPTGKPPGGGSSASCLKLSYNLYPGETDATTGGGVTALQNFLADGGYFTDTPTGVFDQATILAVQQWQSDNGVVSSGTPDTTGFGNVGPLTRAAMVQSCSGSSSNSSTNNTTVTTNNTNAPTATFTVDGVHSETVPTGTSLDFIWRSTNAVSGQTTVTVDSPDTCGNSTGTTWPWAHGNSISGTFMGVTADCQIGHTYTRTYTVTASNNHTASDTTVVRVVSKSTSLPDHPAGLSASCAANTASLSWKTQSSATSYYLYVTDSAAGGVMLVDQNIGNVTSYSIPTLYGPSYNWTVSACDANGCGSAANGKTFSCQTTTTSTSPSATFTVGNGGTSASNNTSSQLAAVEAALQAILKEISLLLQNR